MPSNRNSAGADIDPGVVKQAANGTQRGGFLPGLPSGTVTGGTKQPISAQASLGWPLQATAAQPTQIPGVDGAWMGPLNPLVPTAPGEVRGRVLDYMVGWNVTTNNQRLGQMSVPALRALARNCDLVNIAIDTRKDQLEAGTFVFKLMDDKNGFKSSKDPRIKELREFFRFPDRKRPQARWLRKMADDLLVVDAPCVHIRRNRAGKPYSMRVIDTATIKPLIDADGDTPDAPAPAYQQWLKGVPASDYAGRGGPDVEMTADEMLWHPRNPRPDTLFGWSAVEQIVLTVNQAIRRQLMILAGYTEGTIPEALAPVPIDWTLEQIAQFQIYWNELLAGKFGEQRGIRFVPAGMDKAVFTKRWEDHAEFDEWLARVVMAAFRLPNTWAVKSNNRAVAGVQADTTNDEGCIPFLAFVCEFMNMLIWRGWGYTDIVVAFQDQTTSDELTSAQASNERMKLGRATINEERGRAGEDPFADPEADIPHVLTATGLVPLKAPEPAPAPEPGKGGEPVKGAPAAKDGDQAAKDQEALVEKVVMATLAKAKKKALMDY